MLGGRVAHARPPRQVLPLEHNMASILDISTPLDTFWHGHDCATRHPGCSPLVSRARLRDPASNRRNALTWRALRLRIAGRARCGPISAVISLEGSEGVGPRERSPPGTVDVLRPQS